MISHDNIYSIENQEQLMRISPIGKDSHYYDKIPDILEQFSDSEFIFVYDSSFVYFIFTYKNQVISRHKYIFTQYKNEVCVIETTKTYITNFVISERLLMGIPHTIKTLSEFCHNEFNKKHNELNTAETILLRMMNEKIFI